MATNKIINLNNFFYLYKSKKWILTFALALDIVLCFERDNNNCNFWFKTNTKTGGYRFTLTLRKINLIWQTVGGGGGIGARPRGIDFLSYT